MTGGCPSQWFPQLRQLANPDSAVILDDTADDLPRLETLAYCYQGSGLADIRQFRHLFWELERLDETWVKHQSSPSGDCEFSGMHFAVKWEGGQGELASRSPMSGRKAWGKKGVAIAWLGTLPASLYIGTPFDNSAAVIVPTSDDHLLPVWCYCRSSQFNVDVRKINQKAQVANATMVKVPFDLNHWTKIAAEQYPDGLPEPRSDDPTQWLFKGNVVGSEQTLHVALLRLLGYRWPEQKPDELDALADEDGIVCLPAVAGETPAHERLRRLIEVAYGESFAQQTIDEVLAFEGTATLEDWLRDKAFASHVKLFHNRPFIWHIWDRRKDGFSAHVNYHRLDHHTLEKLTYTHLNWWIERQRSDMANDVAGAEARLAAAQQLQTKLKLILEGEDPYDIHVRWKPLAEQPLGWNPDLDDGVRLNIRPFVKADVLRAKLASLNWNKDQGKNPDGSERLNDLHTTLAEKRVAREDG
jgi:hypothetical protein